jgi:hypothetical protein
MDATRRQKAGYGGEITEFWVVLQQGGSSSECYANLCVSETEAKRTVRYHENATFEATYVKVTLRDPVSLAQAADISAAMAESATKFTCLQAPGSFGAIAGASM